METRSKASRQHRSLIEKLPVEILLEIFEYLDSWSMRRCSEVCIMFFHLTLRRKFKKFFKLTMSEEYLASNCGIGKTFAPGKRTKRTFDYLTLESVNLKTIPFATNFFNRLGEEITGLHIHESFFKPAIIHTEKKDDDDLRQNILKHFPNLKDLSVNTNLALGKIRYFPLSLKTIFVNATTYYQNQKDVKDFLVNQMGLSNLEKLNFSFISRTFNFQDQRMHIYKHLKISDVVTAITEMGEHWDIQINCNLLEHAVIGPSCITGLYYFEVSNIPYNSLKQLPNLKDLILFLNLADTCLGEHQENLDLSQIKQLSVTAGHGTKCEICISQMISSFSGLTELSFRGNLTESQIRLIFDKLPKLKNLELIGRIPKNIFDSSDFASSSIDQLKSLQELFIIDITSNSETTLSNDCLLKFAFLPNLKSLRLSQSNILDQFKIDGIRNLVRQCSNISSFCSTDIAFTGEMVREMLHGWPQLSTLMLPEVTFDKETLDFAKANCRLLRYVSVSDQNRDTFSEKWSIFKNIPCLKIMKIEKTFLSRSEYYHQMNNDNKTSRYSWTDQDHPAAYRIITQEDEDFGFLKTDDELSEDENDDDIDEEE